MPVFLCEFGDGQYQDFLDVKRLLRERGLDFEVESSRDEAGREVRRIWLDAPSAEAVAAVRQYYRKRQPFKSLLGRVLRWRRRP